ncbi:hypothetical protein PPL19_07536 [Pseudomonas psychrotolerans L19]|uniref:hypothetical protein n=1 Tax=Pseudomonas TaxID=286 RepID=UPI00023A1760|nr:MULTISPECIES: hypothetical protein [Pseudomonas]EHK71517.1 hypothetical protein PPL19_07536 [Pseudomonas psychrotolerans L19]MBA1180445.1 hypothetical protein [Pseudomonas psychrotolerans]MBA1210791.1 hypothetical protein [Pseudomonas psychrotolerans]TCQ87926.1 hypothetical protein EC839_106203 [Pseudomonas sp. JUb52]
MNVTSSNSLYAGVQAYQNGSRTVEKAGAALASQTARNEQEALGATTNSQADLASELVNLEVGKYQALAGTKVMQASQETLGRLLDTRA